MNYDRNLNRMGSGRKALAKLLVIVAPIIAVSLSGSAMAQIALSGSDLILPATAPLTADMVILKTANSGSIASFSVVVTNTGTEAVTGAVVTDTADTCSKSNPVTITGNGVPEGSFTIANLTGSGIALDTLQSGQTATLTYTCQGK